MALKFQICVEMAYQISHRIRLYDWLH